MMWTDLLTYLLISKGNSVAISTGKKVMKPVELVKMEVTTVQNKKLQYILTDSNI